jgi:signal transduction histidine kinase
MRSDRVSAALRLSLPTPDSHRFEFAFRSTVVLLTVSTLVVAFTHAIHGHTWAPGLDVALDTTATVVTGLLAILAWVRFRERQNPFAFYHAAAYIALATAYAVSVAVSVALPAVEHLKDPLTAQTFVFAVGRILAAVFLVVGGTATQLKLHVRHPGILLPVPGILVAATAVVLYLLVEVPAPLLLLMPSEAMGGLPEVTTLGALVQVVTATLFFEAAWVVRGLWHRDSAIMDAWVAVGLVFAGFAELQWAIYPSGHPGQVSIGDLLRLAFFLCLLLGIRAEARAALQRLRAANHELADLRDAAADQAAIEERARLARELHDGLAQDLWLAKLKAGQLSAIAGLPSGAAPLVAETQAAIDSGLAEARQAVLALRTATELDDGFCELMGRFLEDFGDRFGMRVEFACDGDTTALAARTQAEVLRIAQEALTNARKHADASMVGVRMHVAGERLSVRITDNGRGFDAATTSGGFGQGSMRERAALIGARLEVRSRPGEGTTVLLTAPLRHRPGEPAIAETRP